MHEPNYGSEEFFYNQYYGQMCSGKNGSGKLAKRAISSTHRKLENNVSKSNYNSVLELGGGNGEHLDFVSHNFDKYTIVDLRVCELNGVFKQDLRINSLVANAESLPFADNSFDRVVVTCLLHHVDNPEKVFLEIDRVLKVGGAASIFLSCDPGLLVRLLRFFTTARTARRLGFAGYDLMNARGHKNHVGSLVTLARYVFRQREMKESWYPLHIKSWNLNGYLNITLGKKPLS
jgi:phosphatidylethanolamine/phosphatidyl-N-methylethanolamine N-methyltransferase